jgi:glyoxylase-like metal-dependent hydrolase (beta-lactamase superfamily II)
MATEIPFVRELDVTYGAGDRGSPLIRRVVAENPSRFTYLGTGTYLVGQGDVAVIDPGPAIGAHVDAVLAALEPGERITHILVTHTHSDHSPATRLLQERVDAPSLGFGPHGPVPSTDPEDLVVFDDPEADGPFPDDEADRAPKPGEELKEGADTDFVPDFALVHGETLAGPGWTFEAIHTPGHTSNHLCYALAEERALFSGDHVMGWSTSVIGPPDGNMGQYLDSLGLLLVRDDERYWPTHGPPILEPRRHVAAFLAHRQEREDQISTVLAEGPATLAEIVPRLYASVQKRLWHAASASMYAHLLGMVEDGRVVVAGGGPARRTSRYERVTPGS